MGIWCENDVRSTSMRRDASTLIQRHFRTKCPLGFFWSLIRDILSHMTNWLGSISNYDLRGMGAPPCFNTILRETTVLTYCLLSWITKFEKRDPNLSNSKKGPIAYGHYLSPVHLPDMTLVLKKKKTQNCKRFIHLVSITDRKGHHYSLSAFKYLPKLALAAIFPLGNYFC